MCRITIKHYFDFNGIATSVNADVHSANAWDALRLETTPNNVFALPQTREEWIKRSSVEPFVKEQASTIAALIKGRFKRVNSYGSGPAFLERFIKEECPEAFLQCSDYTALSIERLRKVFTEAEEVITFDMLSGQWQNGDEATLHLLYRVDTAFDNDQWRKVFAQMSAAGIKNILFLPCEYLTFRRLLTQQVKYMLWPLMGRKLAFAGYLRTKSSFLDLFSHVYRVKDEVALAGGMNGFLLTVKE